MQGSSAQLQPTSPSPKITTLCNHVTLFLIIVNCRVIFTRRALDATVALSDAIIAAAAGTAAIGAGAAASSPAAFAVAQLASCVGWATGLAVIVVSAVVGLCLLLSLLRTYQEAAQAPHTPCGE